MSPVVRPVLPLAGPLDEDPTAAVAAIAAMGGRMLDGTRRPELAVARTMLASALVDIDRGAWDERVIEQLAGLDVAAIATVASLLRRCWQAGASVLAQDLQEDRDATTAALTAALGRLELVMAQRDRCREAFGQVLAAARHTASSQDSEDSEGGEDSGARLAQLLRVIEAAAGRAQASAPGVVPGAGAPVASGTGRDDDGAGDGGSGVAR